MMIKYLSAMTKIKHILIYILIRVATRPQHQHLRKAKAGQGLEGLFSTEDQVHSRQSFPKLVLNGPKPLRNWTNSNHQTWNVSPVQVLFADLCRSLQVLHLFSSFLPKDRMARSQSRPTQRTFAMNFWWSPLFLTWITAAWRTTCALVSNHLLPHGQFRSL